jgi:hypothetical protein
MPARLVHKDLARIGPVAIRNEGRIAVRISVIDHA